MPGVKTGVDFLDHLRKSLKQTGRQLSDTAGLYCQEHWGKDFDVLKAINNIGEVMDIKSVYHVRWRKDSLSPLLPSLLPKSRKKS